MTIQRQQKRLPNRRVRHPHQQPTRKLIYIRPYQSLEARKINSQYPNVPPFQNQNLNPTQYQNLPQYQNQNQNQILPQYQNQNLTLPQYQSQNMTPSHYQILPQYQNQNLLIYRNQNL